MRHLRHNRGGFTLIEMIVAIAIGAIILAVAGMGIVNVTNGLFLTRQNAHTALKAQAAMMRIEKEFHIITAVSSGSATRLDYTNNRGGIAASHTLELSGPAIQLDGDTLVDGVTSLRLSYSAAYTGPFTPVWSAGDKVINISFTLSGSGGSQSTFTTRVRSVKL
ncbi:MAG: prepilin-type N-terminal cleavage/methylation domain-containing protein [Nitrospiraceae bacterium]|nr:prepilin-type N-terminal cleavage/methylation domain-containing protein [Nitrospiraceae bacterium]